MRNGFGLRLLHKFLSLPFLQLQRETLTALLARNKRDTEVSSMELTEFLVNEHNSIHESHVKTIRYTAFLLFLIDRARPMPIITDFWKIWSINVVKSLTRIRKI